MPSTPTTKSQVQAYRFVLRRMQSALVRKDAVMLHDPMRTHTRATIVGVCLGAIGMIGFLIWGLLSPSPKPPDADGIVVGKPSGAVYVLLKDQEKGRVLVPTFNLASARLLLLARSNPQEQQQQAAPVGEDGAAAAPVDPMEPKFIPDDKLAGIARERLTGIQDGPQLLPTQGQRIDDNWAICDAYQLNRGLDDPASENRIETTVLAGHGNLGPELAQNEALLVRSPNQKTYLVYRTPATANIKNASTVRAEVDMTNASVRAALDIEEAQVRQITQGLLNAIPEQTALKAPAIEGLGGPSTVNINGLPVGSVVQVDVAGGLDYYVILRNGVQKIKNSTANLIRFTATAGGAPITRVRPDQIPGATVADAIDEKSFPEVVPEVLLPENYPVACLGWTVVGEGPNADEQTKVYVGKDLPAPRDPGTGRQILVDISTPSLSGQRLNHFYMPPGRAAVVRGAASREDFSTGPIYLISDRGVKFGVPDARTAAALGLANQRPAPDAIVGLLPDGASLNTRDVLQTYDSVPVAPGQFPSTAPQQPAAQPGPPTQNGGG